METKIKILFTFMTIVFLNASLCATEIEVKDSANKTNKVDSTSKKTQVYMEYINLLDKKDESKTDLFGYVSKLFSMNVDKKIDVDINYTTYKNVLVSQDKKSQSSNMTIIARKTIFEW